MNSGHTMDDPENNIVRTSSKKSLEITSAYRSAKLKLNSPGTASSSKLQQGYTLPKTSAAPSPTASKNVEIVLSYKGRMGAKTSGSSGELFGAPVSEQTLPVQMNYSGGANGHSHSKPSNGPRTLQNSYHHHSQYLPQEEKNTKDLLSKIAQKTNAKKTSQNGQSVKGVSHRIEVSPPGSRVLRTEHRSPQHIRNDIERSQMDKSPNRRISSAKPEAKLKYQEGRNSTLISCLKEKSHPSFSRETLEKTHRGLSKDQSLSQSKNKDGHISSWMESLGLKSEGFHLPISHSSQNPKSEGNMASDFHTYRTTNDFSPSKDEPKSSSTFGNFFKDTSARESHTLDKNGINSKEVPSRLPSINIVDLENKALCDRIADISIAKRGLEVQLVEVSNKLAEADKREFNLKKEVQLIIQDHNQLKEAIHQLLKENQGLKEEVQKSKQTTKKNVTFKLEEEHHLNQEKEKMDHSFGKDLSHSAQELSSPNENSSLKWKKTAEQLQIERDEAFLSLSKVRAEAKSEAAAAKRELEKVKTENIQTAKALDVWTGFLKRIFPTRPSVKLLSQNSSTNEKIAAMTECLSGLIDKNFGSFFDSHPEVETPKFYRSQAEVFALAEGNFDPRSFETPTVDYCLDAVNTKSIR